jgi:hypothetical protein
MNEEAEKNRHLFLLQYGSASKMKEILSMKHVEHQAQGARLGLALKNPAVDHEIVDMAWNHPWTRIRAASHPAISAETHTKALNFDNPDVQEAALMNPRTKLHHREERAKNSRYSYIREMAQSLNDDWRVQHKGD